MRFYIPEDMIPGGRRMTAKERYKWKKRWVTLVWQERRYRWTFIGCFLGFSFLGFLVLGPLLVSETRQAEEKILLPVWILVMSAFTAHFIQFVVSRPAIRRQMGRPRSKDREAENP